MVGGESVADVGARSVQQHDKDDAADLVGQGRTESGDTSMVDGAFRLRLGRDGRRTVGGRAAKREWACG